MQRHLVRDDPTATRRPASRSWAWLERRILVVAALVVADPTIAAARQANPQTRQGLAVSFGFGYAAGGLRCDGCGDRSTPEMPLLVADGSMLLPPSVYLQLGRYVRPDLLLAAESIGWVDFDRAGEDRTLSLSGVLQWYPRPSGGSYLKAGAGVTASNDDEPGAEVHAAGPAFTIGAGHDLRVSRNFSMSPYLSYLWSSSADVDGVRPGARLVTNLVLFGFGFTFH